MPSGKENTFKNLINNVDGNENIVVTYNDLNIEECTCVLNPAPYITDKVDQHFDKIWQEFLMFIGISSTTIEKKERLIKDEVKASLGGNLAGRFNRFEARKDGIEIINEKFKTNIICSYYDDEPTTKKEKGDKNDDTV